MPASPELPPGYESQGLLRPGDGQGGGQLVKALWKGQRVVVRTTRTAETHPKTQPGTPPGGLGPHGELAVLAAVDHPGLTRLLDHGALPGNRGGYVTRTWVEGQDLSAWASGADPRSIGAAIARMTPALEHLHSRGFLHGDLKPENAFVRPDGSVVLTDFDLAQAHRGSSPPRDGPAESTPGTLFAVAPEILRGLNPSPRSDLFAVGVMLHQLLIGRRASARDFYGKFPAEDYFSASGTRPDELPEWSRDLVVALLDRDPNRRPRSAEAVGRALGARLGLAGLFVESRVHLQWPPLQGREAWAEAWLETLSREGTDFWLQLPEGEGAGALSEALAISGTLRGRTIQPLDLTAELEQAGSEAQVEAWALACCERGEGTWIFAPLPPESHWERRAFKLLAGVVAQQRSRGLAAPAGLVALAAGEPETTQSAWERVEVPRLGVEDVASWLREAIDAEPGRAGGMAEALCAAAGGTASGLERALDAACKAGWFLGGDERPRLRSGPLPASFEARPTALPKPLDAGSADLLAALQVCGGRASATELIELCAAPAGSHDSPGAMGSIEPLVQLGLVEYRGALTLACTVPHDLIDEARWCALHAARARQLDPDSSAVSPTAPNSIQALIHRWRAGEVQLEEAGESCEELLNGGYPELALLLADGLCDQAAARGQVPARFTGVQALAWAAIGQTQRALEIASKLEQEARDTAPEARALAERIRSRVAVLEHEPARALEHLERANALQPLDGGETALARIRVLFNGGSDDELLKLAGELREQVNTNEDLFRQRNWDNIRAMEAMARFRKGDVQTARTQLAEQAREARAAEDPLREAGLRINLGVLERRAGASEVALGHLERAVQLHAEAGTLHGLARSRAMLGGLVRDLGDLCRAAELLGQVEAARERLGDRFGAVATRGMLGLTLADQGRIAPALQLLEDSARALRELGRSRDAQLLEARADELRARIGSAPEPRTPDPLSEGDPRVLLIRARTALLRGDSERAASDAERAGKLSRSLGLTSLQPEIDFVRDRIAGIGPSAPARSDAERVHAMLCESAIAPQSAAELADRLEARGQLSLAARLLVGCTLRSASQAESSTDLSAAFAQRAQRLLDDCGVGLTLEQAEHMRGHLLGYPDPWPEDLSAFGRHSHSEEEFEMELIELLEINHLLVTQEKLSSLLGTIVEQAIAVSGAQRGFLILEECGELKVDTALDSLRGGISAPEVEVSGSVLQQALELMHPIRVSNAIDDPLLGAAPSVANLDLRSILCAPFKINTELRGVIYLDHRLRESAFDARSERLLRLLADQAALAIQQVKRIEQIKSLNRELEQRVERQSSDLETARSRLREAGLPNPSGGLVGDSEPMRSVHALIERAAQVDLAVLIYGQSGTGKELAARALHDMGPRAQGPFESENCAAIPATLMEAELFGARRGAFTGADRDRPGLFERAHRGTVFLDEIGELPIELQSKLLRVLETGQFRRLGDSSLRRADFRLVAATNRNLADEVAEKRFRADLFYRLDGLRIEMPPLSTHLEDLPALIDHFMRTREARGEKALPVDRKVMSKLAQRPWPGNVRELFNELARLCVLSEERIDDPGLIRAPERIAPMTRANQGIRSMEDIEREAIMNTLEACGGDKNEAARHLGISRAKIYQRLKQWSAQEGSQERPGQERP